MQDTPLAEGFLQQDAACHWILDRNEVFVRVYGDSFPILGVRAADLVGRTLAETLDNEQALAWTNRLSRALGGECVPLRHRHGSAIWNLIVFPLRSGDSIDHAGVTAREVTPWDTAEQELRNTVLGALKAMEFERKSMSRFLHDNVGQNLTAFGLQLDLIRMDVQETAPDLCGRIQDVQKVLEEMMERVREYSYELNPATVERAGLRPALDRLAVRVRERFTGAVRLNVDPSLKLDPKVASAMYFIAQEAVENAVQHSGCSIIEVAVKSARTGSYLEVKDNGRGFDPGDIRGGYRGLGLLSMEHYAVQGGLELSIMSNREAGSTVRAVAPHGA
jgi:signal transduction histidine kinase